MSLKLEGRNLKCTFYFNSVCVCPEFDVGFIRPQDSVPTLLPPVSSFPTPGKPAQLLSWSQERLQSRHTTQLLQVLEETQAMAPSPAAVIVPDSLAFFTQSKKVDLGILKDSWIVLDFTPFLSIVRAATFVLFEIS